MGTTDAGISNTILNTEKGIQRKPANSGATEFGYHLSIYIERTTRFSTELKRKESGHLLKIYGIASSNTLTEF